jgi:hypothetical protein
VERPHVRLELWRIGHVMLDAVTFVEQYVDDHLGNAAGPPTERVGLANDGYTQ